MGEYIDRYYYIWFALCLGAIAILAFYVGMLEGERRGSQQPVLLACSDSVLASQQLRSSTEPKNSIEVSERKAEQSTGAFAGSKNGTKYYSPGCPALDRIKPENIIWFDSAEDATLQGYTPASC